MNTEPVVTVFTPVALFHAAIAILLAFNVWHPSADQLAAMEGLLVLLIAGAATLTRSKVSPSVTNEP